MSEPKADTDTPEAILEWLVEHVPGARWVDFELDDGTKGRSVWVPFGEGLEIPVAFEWSGSGSFDWTMRVGVDHTGRPQCMQLICHGLVTPEAVHRFPLGRLLREAVQRSARPVDEVPHRRIGPADPDEAQRIRSRVAAQLRKRPNGKRRHRLTDERLAEIAAVYRAHVATGKPSQAVAREFHYSEAGARRVVREARLRGFLGPASPGRGGEQLEGGTDAS